ncbi:hypothetical protein DVA86_20510 [Streptomyces armeniacus]|uniref:Uncharacterized protein n=1 Tax=Streptomyces armeniacus TaxID=83291 RepID=A0A345XSR1_9ACTN|nr:hypothetical protein [Streptomyces armeniacus]AXK34677.1 hypothetical protein DVA86_20510 [Streptomyces armeniacus]
MSEHTDQPPHIPSQRQQPPAADHDQALNALPPPPAEPTDTEQPQLTPRAWWNEAWSDGGYLYDRWEDLRQAPELGWHHMAHWVKTVLALSGASVLILLLYGASDVAAEAGHQLITAAPHVQIGTDTSLRVWAVIDQPIRSYTAQHSADLAISGSTVYTLWQITGLLGLIGGFVRSTAARLTWTCWGTGSVAMVWSATPADSRAIAAGIAVLAWTLASAAALRGLSLRPVLYIRVPRTEIHQDIHLPAVSPAVADDNAPKAEVRSQ